ncbi:HTH-type transcriptional regulator BetI [Microbacterium azadirachtae]|uniref:HTH-type transcriptional regulator BetI n=1 Tax=Microbacterium azadirachtae TaxID=582680 RepID=A0A0F0KTS8_9MICO|nr:TetR/AcrR family transcriptional regulator [Microbacterium azadirachtae]KJL24302.1 HTH-type transcriptional regulator BetI [Microbacterium azadirachtae]
MAEKLAPAEQGARRRGPYAGTSARRAEIVRAALAGFAEHGYDRASLRDIAVRAGVTHAALLRHFASKEELLLAALAQRDADDEAVAHQIMTSRVPAERVLASVLEDEFSHPNHQRNWLAITIAATNPSHPAHEFFMARKQRMRQYLNGGQLAMLNDGETVTAEEKVTMVLAMIDGLRIQSLLDPDRPVLPLLERFVRMISTNEA